MRNEEERMERAFHRIVCVPVTDVVEIKLCLETNVILFQILSSSTYYSMGVVDLAPMLSM